MQRPRALSRRDARANRLPHRLWPAAWTQGTECLAHFAVDADLVYVTTQLAGPRTRFLPFNKGKFGGAGNPPVPPTRNGYATGYLWEETWARDSVLDLVRQFIHEVEEEDEKGRKTGRRFLIFPRYHQWDAVRRLEAAARAEGAGRPVKKMIARMMTARPIISHICS